MTSALESRKRLQLRMDQRPQLTGNGDGQLPPLLFADTRSVWLTAAVDPSLARQALPADLELADSCSAAVTIWHSGPRSTLGATTGVLVGLEVKGFDAPDGLPGLFLIAQSVSENARPAFSSNYYADVEAAKSSFQERGEVFGASAWLPSGHVLTLNLQLTSRNETNAGVLSYVLRRRDSYVRYECSFNCEVFDGKVTSFEVGPAAHPILRSFDYSGPIFAGAFRRMDFTLGTPLEIDPRGASFREASPENLLEDLGRAAIMLSNDGRIMRANRRARELLDTNNVSLGSRERDLIKVAIDALRTQNHRPAAIPFRRSDNARPLFGRLVALSRDSSKGILMLLSDPDAASQTDVVTSLNMLGLTRSEAQLASLVGQGLTVLDAATLQGVTENTARSTLKSVYAKLGIARQSELGRLVAHLGVI